MISKKLHGAKKLRTGACGACPQLSIFKDIFKETLINW